MGVAAEARHGELGLNRRTTADAPTVARAQSRQIISNPWAFKRSLEMWPSPV